MVVNLGQKDPISNFLIGYNSGFIRSTPCPQSSRIALGLTPGFLMKYFPPLLNATADYYNDSISFVEDYNNELVRTSNSSLQTDDGHPLWKEYTLTSIFVLLIIVTIVSIVLYCISNSSLQTDDGHPLWKEYTLTSIFVLLIIVTIVSIVLY
uniref:Uncharacterized protein n=1 Tax=Cacopsylla melanoneura TaxID=428564 RepID=A0A8D8RY14_9HEMI